MFVSFDRKRADDFLLHEHAACKRGESFRLTNTVYTLTWLLDVEGRTLHTHSGAPFQLFGKGFGTDVRAGKIEKEVFSSRDSLYGIWGLSFRSSRCGFSLSHHCSSIFGNGRWNRLAGNLHHRAEARWARLKTGPALHALVLIDDMDQVLAA